MARLLERVANSLGFYYSPSAREAIDSVKQQTEMGLVPDPDARRTPSEWDIEIGDPGTETWADLYKAIPKRDDPTDLSIYSDMRFGNSTAQAMLRVLQLPILSTKWNLVPGPEDEGGEVSNFVNKVLSSGDYEGGMEIPMHQVLYEITTAFWAGYKPHEIVFKVIDGDKVGIRKIAPRSPMSTKPVVDRHGNLIGAFQESDYMSEHKVIFIPREKLFWYAHRMEESNWYGESDFRTAYLHYETLRKLYIIDNKTHEVTAIPIRVAQPTMGGMTESVKQEVFKKIKRVGLDTAILLPKDFELSEFGAKNASGSSRNDSINHHTTQMAMSILGQFLQLGTNGQGTYNLSQDQSDMFFQVLSAEMRSISAAFTSQVIAPLVKVNFGDKPGITPRFIFSEMTDHVRKTVESIFLAIVQGGGDRLSDEFIEALGRRVAAEMGLDLSIIEAMEDDVPMATKDKETMQEEAETAFEAQVEQAERMASAKGADDDDKPVAGAAAKMKAAGGKTPGKTPARKEDNKGTSKGNLSSELIDELVAASENAKDFFGRVKLQMANDAGIGAPATPQEVKDMLENVNLSADGAIDNMLTVAYELVYGSSGQED